MGENRRSSEGAGAMGSGPLNGALGGGAEDRTTPAEAWRGPVRGYDLGRSLVALFDEQVARTPEAVALEVEAADGAVARVSYRELDGQARRLAVALRTAGVRPEEPVVVYAPRGLGIYVALLGTWRAGAVYTPVDSTCPRAHVEHVVADSGARFVLSTDVWRAEAEGLAEQLVLVDRAGAPNEADERAELPEVRPDRFAMLLYTSGSTGKPKGVQHREIQLLNRFQWLWERYPFLPDDCVCQRTPLHFQPSVWELLGGLLRGVRTVILPDAVVKDPKRFAARLQEHRVTHLNIVPSLLRMLLEGGGDVGAKLATLRWLVAAGEPLEAGLVDQLFEHAPGIRLTCDYGSTETNGVLYFDATRAPVGQELPPFRPIANVRVHVLGESGEPVGLGEPGELCFSGACMAMGYWNQPEHTAERFAEVRGQGGAVERVYRSGDFASWTQDGGLRIVGRRDRQVKIRGNRVDLAGVEAAIGRQEGIRECRVVVASQADATRLVAFAVPAPGRVLDPDVVRASLARQVPEYMVPAVVRVVETLPRLPNGKVDGETLKREATEPREAGIGARVRTLAAQVLGVETGTLRMDAKFYALGFDSASIARYSVELEKAGWNASVTDLYAHPTLEELVEWLEGEGSSRAGAEHAPMKRPAVPGVATGARSAEIGDFGGGERREPAHPFSRVAAGRLGLPGPQRGATRPAAVGSAAVVVEPGREAPAEPSTAPHKIAVIGLAGRFPGADDVDRFWEVLRSGEDCVSALPTERFPDALELGPGAAGGYLRDVAGFDPAFFDISPREAVLMDPQQRLMLEACWNALEHGGYAAGRTAERRIGVFLGARPGDYADVARQRGPDVTAFGLTGTDQAILAGRVAYLLNLNGPAITIDTACSSSLVALHLACQSLRAGECELAVAGGVHVMSTTHLFRASSQLGMVSPVGRCMPFDDRAGGMVPSEGVGAVLLKPLAAAQRDGDTVWAVIVASNVNQDGKTNGITAPSPRAQAQLLEDTYARAGLDPARLGYLEAHGTGTKQGDPIEVKALTECFRHWTAERQFCALGSVKSNIGHAVAAAGIAGFLKTVLALHHELIPPTVHYRRPNPALRIEESPFVVDAAPRRWQTRPGAPRMAAISAFGFSGTNCHVVLEEAPAVTPGGPRALARPQLFPISGKSERALRSNALRLKAWLDRGQEGVRLDDVAFTLQRGRAHFTNRVCLVAADVAALQRQLDAQLDGHPGSSEGTPAALRELRQRYLAGEAVDWTSEPGAARGGRVALPTYGFDRQRCWVDAAQAPQAAAAGGGRERPWLVLEEAIGGEGEVRARIPSDAWVFTEHRVGDEAVLPGTAFLELARRVLARRLGRSVPVLANVAWLQPLRAPATSDAVVDVSVTMAGGGLARFEIASAGEGDRVVHCQGEALLDAPRLAPPADAPRLDDVRAACPSLLDAAGCYRRFQERHLRYQGAFRLVQRLSTGDGLAVATLASLPAYAASTSDEELNPALLDAAMQSAIGLDGVMDQGAAPWMPYVVERVEWYGPVEGAAFALARGGGRADGDQRQDDVFLLDREGKVLLRVAGLVRRQARARSEDAGSVSFYQWGWRSARASLQEKGGRPWLLNLDVGHWGSLRDTLSRLWPEATEPVEIQADCAQAGRELAARVRSSGAPEAVVVLLPSQTTAGGDRGGGRFCTAVLDAVRALLERGKPGPVRVVIGFTSRGDLGTAAHRAIGALARSVRREIPSLDVRTVELVGEQAAGLGHLLEEVRTPGEPAAEVRWERGERSVRHFSREAQTQAAEGGVGLRRGGVYVVSGGMGGVGYALAEHLARKHEARLCILGRSPLTPQLTSRLQALGDALYLPCDVVDSVAVFDAMRTARIRMGDLSGVIHCAGVLRDGSIRTKTAQDVAEVFAPKVSGALNLDRALAHVRLDFFAVCSSIAAVAGAPMQAEYAAANAFLDHFMQERARHVQLGLRHGHSVSIAWPYWADGGMRVDAATLEHWRATMGLAPLSAPAACAAFEEILRGGGHRVALFCGDPARFERHLAGAGDGGRAFERAAPVTSAVSGGAGGEAAPEAPEVEHLEADLLAMAAETLGASPGALVLTGELSEYGLESVLMGDLSRRIGARFGVSIAPSIFFDYTTLARVAEYLRGEHGPALAEHYRSRAAASAPVEVTSSEPLAPEPASRRVAPVARDEREPIAIVGMAARLPGAGDLDALLEMLEAGTSVLGRFPEVRSAPGSTSPGPVGAYVEDADCFDPRFFGLSMDEARLMDPQQRVLLETTWAAVEDAGRRASELRGERVGVFVGVFSSDHAQAARERAGDDPRLLSCVDHCMIANRISHFFDWRGPSESIDTACSSSLVALHHAISALRGGECEAALVGGVHLLLSPAGFGPPSRAGMLSPSGVARPFDARADGYVRGEGAAALLLKPLSRALADGDRVRAVVRGSAIGHNGRSFALTAPSAAAQTRVIVEAVRASGVDPSTISYLEAHGTGAPMSDSCELRAYRDAFVELGTDPRRVWRVGSMKGSVGHLEAAAGVAAIAKAVLCLERRVLPRVAGFSALGPSEQGAPGNLRVLAETEPWSDPAPLRCGVHGFGLGGTNAHVILEEAPPPAERRGGPGPQLLVFSARTERSLTEELRAQAEFLRRHPTVDLRDVAFTVCLGREPFEVRVAMVVDSVGALLARIDEIVHGGRCGPTCWTSASPGAGLVTALPEAVRRGDLEALGAAFCQGLDVPWAEVAALRGGRRISLPTYRFEAQRCTLEPTDGASPERTEAGPARSVAALVEELLGAPLPESDLHRPLPELGFDSIAALKLRHRLETDFGLEVPLAALAQCETLDDVTRAVQAAGGERQAAGVPGGAAGDRDLQGRLLSGDLEFEDLSEEALTALLGTLSAEGRHGNGAAE